MSTRSTFELDFDRNCLTALSSFSFVAPVETGKLELAVMSGNVEVWLADKVVVQRVDDPTMRVVFDSDLLQSAQFMASMSGDDDDDDDDDDNNDNSNVYSFDLSNIRKVILSRATSTSKNVAATSVKVATLTHHLLTTHSLLTYHSLLTTHSSPLTHRRSRLRQVCL